MSFEGLPLQIQPYVIMDDLNQPIPVAYGPFRLRGSTEETLHSNLVFKWTPSVAIEFDGTYESNQVDLETPAWTLQSDDGFTVPAHVTNTTLGGASSVIRGSTNAPFSIGSGPSEQLRFSLANFPDYHGEAVRYQQHGRDGFTCARVEMASGIGTCRVDQISEVGELVKRAKREAGFVISHVGLWTPASGAMTKDEATSITRMLHFWFGFLRGAWTGPIFPQGLVDGQVAWREFSRWKIHENREVVTWLPERKPVSISNLFNGFVQHWQICMAKTAHFCDLLAGRGQLFEGRLEAKIIVAQVALELLTWVYVVETTKTRSRSAFKRLSAADRIRELLNQLGVPTAVPPHFNYLLPLVDKDAPDGPSVIARIRNALVHTSEQSSGNEDAVTGPPYAECAQLAIQYVELALLAICGHDGYYAMRSWKGWKGDDEGLVPWHPSYPASAPTP